VRMPGTLVIAAAVFMMSGIVVGNEACAQTPATRSTSTRSSARYDYQRMKDLMTNDRDVSIAICPNGAHFDMWDDAENYFGAVKRFIGRLEAR
jgi:hypothetical protein